jgi:hypothetical protein
MVIPGPAVVTGVFGTSDCSARTAADSWPHPGLVELLNVVNTTPRGRRGLPWLVSDPANIGCRNADHAVDVLGELRQLCSLHSMAQSGTRYPSMELGDTAAAQSPRDVDRVLVAAAPRNTSLSGSTQRQGPLNSISLVYLLNPGQPRPPGERKDQHRGLQTGEHPPEVSTPQCVTERL